MVIGRFLSIFYEVVKILRRREAGKMKGIVSVAPSTLMMLLDVKN